MTLNEIRCQKCDKLMKKYTDDKYTNLIKYIDASKLCEECEEEEIK